MSDERPAGRDGEDALRGLICDAFGEHRSTDDDAQCQRVADAVWAWIGRDLTPALDMLRQHAMGVVGHEYDGGCPDGLGQEARDPVCPVCRALVTTDGCPVTADERREGECPDRGYVRGVHLVWARIGRDLALAQMETNARVQRVEPRWAWTLDGGETVQDAPDAPLSAERGEGGVLGHAGDDRGADGRTDGEGGA